AFHGNFINGEFVAAKNGALLDRPGSIEGVGGVTVLIAVLPVLRRRARLAELVDTAGDRHPRHVCPRELKLGRMRPVGKQTER
ncbi:MAG: hypothetical protein AAFO89_10480, partial [Planctomycetota bacterium]